MGELSGIGAELGAGLAGAGLGDGLDAVPPLGAPPPLLPVLCNAWLSVGVPLGAGDVLGAVMPCTFAVGAAGGTRVLPLVEPKDMVAGFDLMDWLLPDAEPVLAGW